VHALESLVQFLLYASSALAGDSPCFVLSTLNNFHCENGGLILTYFIKGVEDGAIDQNGDEDHPSDLTYCNESQVSWFAHSQLDRAMSEPLPPVNHPTGSIRMFRHSQLSSGIHYNI